MTLRPLTRAPRARKNATRRDSATSRPSASAPEPMPLLSPADRRLSDAGPLPDGAGGMEDEGATTDCVPAAALHEMRRRPPPAGARSRARSRVRGCSCASRMKSRCARRFSWLEIHQRRLRLDLGHDRARLAPPNQLHVLEVCEHSQPSRCRWGVVLSRPVRSSISPINRSVMWYP